MNVNFAERAHNHNWKLDPIVRSLLDTDFYKLLMLQFIWKNFPAVHVTSEVTNRTVKVRLADRVGAAALIDQMEHVRGLRFRRSELVWLAGNTFYGTRTIFEPAFLDWLEHDFHLSGYTVSEHDGQLVLRFSGAWSAVTMWEVYALAIVSELKTRRARFLSSASWSWTSSMPVPRRACGTRSSASAASPASPSRTSAPAAATPFSGMSTPSRPCASR